MNVLECGQVFSCTMYHRRNKAQKESRGGTRYAGRLGEE